MSKNEETIEERASKTIARYDQRLEEQLKELTSENLPCQLSQNEYDEILTGLTGVIEEALRAVVRACTEVALHSGLSQGKAVAELIERTIGGTTGIHHPPMERYPQLPLGEAEIKETDLQQ